LLLLRLAVGVMMIHHGQDKLADPQSFATNYVAALHLPFPLLLAYAAGYAEILGSWLLIFGLFTPLGALALSGTMAVAAYHHILASGFNIYVLELVVLYLGGSIGLLLLGPGRISFDAGLAHELLASSEDVGDDLPSASPDAGLIPVPVEVSSR
jgi:putative oxidoreductase